MNSKIKVLDILEYLDNNKITYEYHGNPNSEVEGYSSLNEYKKGTITWIKEKKYYQKLLQKRTEKIHFSCVITTKEIWQENHLENAIICDNIKYVFFEILRKFFYENDIRPGYGKNTVIGENVKIAENVSVGHNCVIGNGVTIEKGTRIYHNVIIHDNVQIGEDCIIKSGAVIGEEGFGFSEYNDKYYHVPHFGRVVIGNRVEIGSNTCIDRGTMGDTVIGDGTKIDNLCQISHNVIIGENVIITCCADICGSTVIEDHVYIAPNASIINQIKIAKNSFVGIGATIMTNTKENMIYSTNPAKLCWERTDNGNVAH